MFLPAAILPITMLRVTAEGLRDRFLRALVLFGVALVAITECLGGVGLIQRGPLILCWILVLGVALATTGRSRFRFAPVRVTYDPVVLVCSAGIFAILTLTFITAACSAPNSADAMAYHLPRVVYWAEQGSVRFFPTPYFNQIMLQPLAEYMMLHTYVLSGSDRLINFVQWFASFACIVGVSAIARMFGAARPEQAMAALFCATIPAGILASSGAKNDYWLAMWMVSAVYFALRFAETGRRADALFMGAAFGLALLTKGTAYLFAIWPLAAILLARAGEFRKRLAADQGSNASLRSRLGSSPRMVRTSSPSVVLAAAAVLGIALNVPQYLRNYEFSHSIMGFDSAQGDGVYRWRNETFGWKQTTSNMLRNLSEQLGARSAGWNQGVYGLVLEAHTRLGIDVNDRATTWPGTSFAPPRNANHEADAPNRWHLALVLVVGGWLLFSAGRSGEHRRLWYWLSLVCGFVVFCAYLKWQPFMARLFLPLFVLAAPLAGAAGFRRRALQIALCLFLLNNARSPLLENWVRPLRGPNSVLHTARDVQYFADMTQWNNREAYFKAVDVLAKDKCETVGIDINNLQLEYPLQALLRERKPGVRFVHTGVRNVSARYAQPVAAKPCAVACLDCAGDPNRLRDYGDFPQHVTIGNFAIYFEAPFR